MSVHASISSNKIDWDDDYEEAMDLMPLYPLFKEDIQFLMREIKVAKEMELQEKKSANKRVKRQAVTTGIDCNTAKATMAKTESEIAVTQQKIANSTSSLNNFLNMAQTFELKANQTNGTTSATALKLATIRRNSAATSNTTLQNSNKNLATLQTSLANQKADFETFCTIPVPSSQNAACGI